VREVNAGRTAARVSGAASRGARMFGCAPGSCPCMAAAAGLRAGINAPKDGARRRMKGQPACQDAPRGI